MADKIPLHALIALRLGMPRRPEHWADFFKLRVFFRDVEVPLIKYFDVPRSLENWDTDEVATLLKAPRHVVYFYTWYYYYGKEVAETLAYGPRKQDGKKTYES